MRSAYRFENDDRRQQAAFEQWVTNISGMIALLLSIVIAQSQPSVAPSPPPAPVSWQAVKLTADQYAHEVRREHDGTDSDLTAERQVCDCQPPDLASELQTAFGQHGATVKRDTVTACGQTAQRIIATGLATPDNSQRNIEIVAFRREPALYTLMYAFQYAAPMPDAEAQLLTLCGN